MRALRDAIPAAERATRSKAIAATVLALPRFKAAKRVAIFASFGSEVETLEIENAALANGAEVFFPRVLSTGELGFFRATRAELVPSKKLGIPEPPEEPARGVTPEAIDFFVVPGVAFDAAQRRLGYGRGYYDRVLARAARAASVGLAFDEQIVPRVPVGPGDMPVDCVVTPTRTL